MKVERKNISEHKIELTIEVSTEDMSKYSKQAAQKISETTKIEGFRPGKAPYEIVQARVGDMVILEEASRIAVSKSIDKAITDSVTEEWIGQPEITITKLAPENPFEYRALMTLLPSATLGDYKNLNLKMNTVKVADEEIEKMIEQLRDVKVKEALVDRASEAGDKIVADVNLFLDKVPLEGGQVKDTAIILGRDYFVPGFDEKVTGIKAGETREFFITYPADYNQKNLAGKKVEFTVKATQIFSRELPEVNDDFVTAFGLKNVEELKKNISKSIEDEKQVEVANEFERSMLEKIVKNSTLGELPDSLIDQEARTMLHELEHNVARSGGKFEDYLSSIGKTTQQLLVEFKPQATDRVKAALVLREIIKAEKIEVNEKEIENELEKLKKQYNHDQKIIESLSSPAYRRHLSTVIVNKKILEKLKEWNTAQTV
jgi:trigger factor